MSDNVVLNVNSTSGAVIAADEVAGVQYQRVKLVDGTADSTAVIPGSTADGLLVNLGANNDVMISGGTVTVDGGVTVINSVTVDDGAASLTVDNDGVFAVQLSSALPAGTNAIGKLAANSSVTIGAVEIASAQTLATVTTVGTVSTITNVVHVDDNSGSLTVDGTVNAAQSGTWTVQPGNTANTTAWKVDGSAVTQPVSGTVAATQSGIYTVQPGNTPNTTPWLASIHDGTTKATVRDLAANDALNVAIVDGSGNQVTTFGGGTQYTEDVASAADPVGNQIIARRRDTLATETTTDGDNTAVNTTGKGELYVKHVDAIPVTDNSGSLTVDGTVAATQSGTWNVGTVTTITNVVHVDDNSSSLTVDGTVAATQSGTWTVQPGNTANTTAWKVDGSAVTQPVSGTVAATIAAGATSIAKLEDVASADADAGVPAMAVRKITPANTSGTDGDYEMLQMSAGRLWTSAVVDTALPAGTNVIGHVVIDSGSTTTVTQATGTSLHTVVDSGTVSTITNVVHVDDNSGSLTVDGTVSAAQSGTWTAQPGNTPNTVPWLISIHDGQTKASVSDLYGTTALNVAIFDVDGNQVSNFGGSTTGGSGDGAILDGVSSSIKATVLDYTNSNPLAVRLTDTAGDYVSAGSGTQYTEDAASAADPTGNAFIARRRDSLSTETTTDGDNTALNSTGKGELYVKHVDAIPVTDNAGSLTVDNNGTFATQATQAGTWTVQPGNTANTTAWKVDGSAVTQPVSGTVTATIAAGAATIAKAEDVASADADVGVPSMAVRKASPANTSGTDGDYEMLQISAGRLWTSATIDTALPAGSNVIGHIIADSGSTTAVTGNVTVVQTTATNLKVDASGVAVPITDNSGSLTVDNAGTFAVQATIAAGATAIAKAEDVASADADVGVPAMAIRKATPANTSGTDGDYEMLQVSAGRLWTSATIDAALPAGANAIGKLATNSGVTIGAVEIAATQTLATVTTVGTVSTITNVVHVDDNAGSLTVDGTVAATQSGTWTVQPGNTANTTAWKVDGSAVTQPVSGTVTATLAATVVEDAASAGGESSVLIAGVRNDAAVSRTSLDGDFGNIAIDAAGRVGIADLGGVISVDDNGGSLTVDGTVAATQSGTWNVGTVTTVTNVVHVDDNSSSLTVDGTVAATQSGTWTVQPGNTANTTAWKVDGSAVTQPVSGTVTATIAAGASTIAKAEDVASADADVGVPAMAIRKATPANTSGTDGDYEMLQVSAGRLWASATIDAALPAGTNVIGHAIIDSGSTTAVTQATGTNLHMVVDSGTVSTITNVVHVDDNSGSLTVDGTVAATQSGTWNVGTVTAITNVVHVDDNSSSLTVDGTVAATQSGVWTTQPGNTPNAVPWLMSIHDGQTKASVSDLYGTTALNVAIFDVDGNQVSNFSGSGSGSGDGAILDGVSSSIKATVLDYTNANPLAVRLTDTAGDYVSAGAGTQYIEDVASASDPTGNALIARRRDSLATETTTDGDNTALNSTGKGELYVKHVDAIPVTDNSGSLTVDGSVTVTQGTGSNLHSVIDSGTITTITNVVHVDDNSGSLTVDGTVASTQSGTWTVQPGNTANTTAWKVDGSAVTQPVSGTVTATIAAGTSTIAKAEDAAHVDADVGVMALAVRKNTAASTSGTDGDYQPLITNTTGHLWVDASGQTLTVGSHAVTNTGTFATQSAQSGTWDIGTVSTVTNVVHVDDNSGSLTVDGTVGATQNGTWTTQPGNTPNTTPWLFSIHDGQTKASVSDLYGTTALNVAMFDGDGNLVTPSTTEYVEDDPSIANPKGSQLIARRRDSLASETSADGDHVAINSTDKGEVYVKHVDAIPITDNSGSLTVDGSVTVTQGTGTNLHTVVDSGTITTVSTVTAVTNVATIGTSVTPGTSAGHLGKAEDAAHTSGDTGVMSLAVRSNTAASTSGSDGDYQPLITNTTGHLWVDASGQTLTVGSHAVTNAGTFAVQATLAAGATAIAKAEDVASADADVGVPAMAIRKATPANTSGTDGDYEMLQISAGRVWTSTVVDTALPAGSNVIGHVIADSGSTTAVTGNVTVVQSTATNLKVDASGVAVPVTDNSGSLTVDNNGTFAVQSTIASGATSIAKAEDVASADADVGVPAMAIRKATPANTSGTDGDYEMLQVSAGRLWASAVIDTALPAGTNVIGHAIIDSGSTTAVTQATGTNLHMVVDSGTVSTITNVVHVDDNSGSLTVDGTVNAVQSGTWTTQPGNTPNTVPWLMAIHDGQTKAQVTDLYGTTALNVAVFDADGSQVSTFGDTQYVEDAPSVADPIGGQLIARRRDSLSTETNADGDNTAINSTGKGELYVKHVDAIPVTDNSGSLTVDNAGTFAVQAAQSGTWNVGTVTTITNVVHVDDNSSSLTVDNAGTFAVQSTIAASATNIAKAEDVASADADVGVPAMAIRKATPGNTSGTDGDYEMLQISAGRLWASATIDAALPAGANAIGKLAANSGVDIGDVDVTTVGTITPGTAATSLGKAEDAGHVSGDVGVMALSVRQDVAAALAGTDADYQPLITDASGRLHVNVGNTVTVGSHAVTNAGTFAVQAAITAASGSIASGALASGSVASGAVVAGAVAAGASSFVKLEDVASADADAGVPAMAIRKASPANTSGTDGDYEMLQMAAGRLWTSAVIDTALPAGSNVIGHAIIDSGSTTAVTQATGTNLHTVVDSGTISTITNVVHVDDNSGSLTVDGSVAATQSGTWTAQPGNTPNTVPWLMAIHDGQTKAQVSDLYGTTALNVIVVDADGNLTSPTNTEYVEDAPSIADPVGSQLLARRRDSLAAETSTDGDYVAINSTNKGEVYVKHVDAIPVTDNSGSLTVDNGGTFAVQATLAAGATAIAKAEDVASADADVGVPAMAVRKATPGNTSGTDGDYEMLQISAGRLWASATIDAALPAGANAIGKLAANSGVTIGAVEIVAAQTLATVTTVGSISTSITPGTAAANLGKAEDAAHADADTGVMALAVRKNTAASTSGTDGDYQPLITNTTGHLWVDASGQTLTVGSHAVTNAGTFAVQAAITAASGSIASGALASGSVASGAIASGAVASGAVASGAFASGSLAAGAVSAGATSFVKLEDVASADADAGVPAMAIRKATPANTSGTDGDYEMLQMSAGRLWVDPSGVTLTVGSHAVTNAGTFAVQVDGASLTALQLIDNASVDHGATVVAGTTQVGLAGRTTDGTAVTSGQTTRALADTLGKQVVLIGAVNDLNTSGITNFTDNTAADVIAAAGVGIKIAVMSVLVTNGHATVSTKVSIRDGTTVKITGYAVAAGGGFAMNGGGHPLFISTANTAVRAICSVTGSDIDVTVTGYKISN